MQLVELLKQSDDNAFTVLYDRYWEKLLTRAVQRLNSTEDACEVVQDVFIRLWNRRDRLAIRNSFHTYISAALKYEVIRKLVTRKRKPTELIDLDEEKENLSLADYSTEQKLDLVDLQQRLENSVRQLPEKCQLVFRLSREKGLSEKEIATNLGISPKTVQGHITRALHSLRSSLNNFFFL